jgi:hypothetical protein
MKRSYLWAIFWSLSCGNPNTQKKASPPPTVIPSATPSRDLTSDYPWVGLILYQDQLRCTGTVLKPGIILTARHCFDNGAGKDLKAITVRFNKKNKDKEETLTITRITSLDFDSAEADLAWLQYDQQETASWSEIARPAIDRTKIPTAATPLVVVGYPTTADGRLVKVLTRNCRRLAKEGTIGPLPRDPGYLGTLYDTDCFAWKGNSGGPFFTIKSKGNSFELDQLIGVVTHTFDLTLQGDILSSALGKDQFGTFVKTVNFTSILASADFDKYVP